MMTRPLKAITDGDRFLKMATLIMIGDILREKYRSRGISRKMEESFTRTTLLNLYHLS